MVFRGTGTGCANVDSEVWLIPHVVRPGMHFMLHEFFRKSVF